MNSTPTVCRLRRAIRAAAIVSLVMLGWSGAGLAATPSQAPPIPPGQSRVWFVRQLLPGSDFHAPMVYVNGAPIARMDQGTTFYRDFAPGQYDFTVENCIPEPHTGQIMTLAPDVQYAIEVQQDDNGPWACTPPQVSYLRQLSPQRALYLLAPATFLGAM